jgi:hypothetical protein
MTANTSAPQANPSQHICNISLMRFWDVLSILVIVLFIVIGKMHFLRSAMTPVRHCMRHFNMPYSVAPTLCYRMAKSPLWNSELEIN